MAREFGGNRFVLLGSSLKHLPEFESDRRLGLKELESRAKGRRRARKTKAWEWAEPPLSRIEAEDWLEKEAKGEQAVESNKNDSGTAILILVELYSWPFSNRQSLKSGGGKLCNST